MEIDAKLVEQQAKQELYMEEFDRQVQEKKIELKTKKSLWQRIFPYTIALTIKSRK